MVLREEKKQQRRERVKQAAIALFGSEGFSGTTMRDIAKQANLGVGTLYNYFESKEALLLQVIIDRSGLYEEQFQQLRQRRYPSAQQAYMAMVDLYLTSFSVYNKTIWRQFLGTVLANKPEIMQTITAIDSLFVSQCLLLSQELIEQKQLLPECDAPALINTLYHSLLAELIAYISTETLPLAQLKENLGRHLQILLKGHTATA